MNKTIRILTSVALIALSACSPLIYGKLDEPSVAVTQSNLAVPAYPGPAINVPVNLFSFPFQLGEVTVDQSSKDSSLKLNSASISIVNGGTATFQNIDEFVLTLTPPGGSAQIVATYKKGTTGSLSPDGKTLTLVPTSDLELLGFLSDKSLTVGFGGSGAPPNVAWTGAATLDFHIIAQKNVL